MLTYPLLIASEVAAQYVTETDAGLTSAFIGFLGAIVGGLITVMLGPFFTSLVDNWRGKKAARYLVGVYLDKLDRILRAVEKREENANHNSKARFEYEHIDDIMIRCSQSISNRIINAHLVDIYERIMLFARPANEYFNRMHDVPTTLTSGVADGYYNTSLAFGKEYAHYIYLRLENLARLLNLYKEIEERLKYLDKRIIAVQSIKKWTDEKLPLL